MFQVNGAAPENPLRFHVTRGFLYDVKVLQFLSVNAPRASVRRTSMGSIDRGEIVGCYVDPVTGNTHGFFGRIARCLD